MFNVKQETVRTFYVIWADSTKESNPGLSTTRRIPWPLTRTRVSTAPLPPLPTPMLITNKILMCLGVTLAEICLKMHYFCNKSKKNGQALEANPSAAETFFSGPHHFLCTK